MNKALYGIKRLFVSFDVVTPFNSYKTFVDEQNVTCSNTWKEVHLSKPGSISYEFKDVNNCIECEVVLECSIKCDFSMDNRVRFYKAVGTNGKTFLVGLGKDYFTVPVSQFNDTVFKYFVEKLFTKSRSDGIIEI